VRSNNYNGCSDHIANNSDVHTNWSAVPEFNSAGIASNINKWNNRHVEPGNYQHCNSRNYNLYVHASGRTVRNHCNTERDHYSAGNTNVHRYWPALPEFKRTGIANNIHQRNYGNMEPCNNKHCHCRHNNLHLYTSRRPVCNNSNAEHHDRSAGNTNVHCYRTTMSKFNCSGITININQWNQRYMESGNHQYCSCRYNNLYIHAISRPMRNNSNVKHYNQSAGNSNVHCYRPALPKQCSAGIACNINQWNQRHLEPGNYQHGNSRYNNLYIHAISRAMRNNSHDKYHHQSAGNTNIHCNWPALPECRSANTSGNIQ